MAIDCVILVGGKGLRLAGVVADRPKPLAPVGGRPFLNHLLDLLLRSGVVRRVVLALGHLSSKVIEHYHQHPPPLPVVPVVETEPLGTGGALLNALSHTQGETVLVLNGNSVALIDWASLLDLHERTQAAVTLALVRVPDASRYGTVEVEGTHVVRFSEKQPPQTGVTAGGLINAGIYLFRRDVLETLPTVPCSLERDILPGLVTAGRVSALVTDAPFIDIGLPETYAAAAQFFDAHGA